MGPDDATTTLRGTSSISEIGDTLRGGSDLDGDGYDDLLVGAPWDDAVAVFRGPLTGTVELADAAAFLLADGTTDLVGSELDFTGDVDGDGEGDLLIGAWYADSPLATAADAGVAYVVLGPVSGTIDLGLADHRYSLEDAGSWLAVSTRRIGDMTGDGVDELAFGAPRKDLGGTAWMGAVYVVEPAASAPGDLDVATDHGLRRLPERRAVCRRRRGHRRGRLGRCASGLRPVRHANRRPSRRRLPGPRPRFGALSVSDTVFVGGEQSDSYVGDRPHFVPDVDGDGKDELAAGAYAYDDGASTSAGRAYVVFGGQLFE